MSLCYNSEPVQLSQGDLACPGPTNLEQRFIPSWSLCCQSVNIFCLWFGSSPGQEGTIQQPTRTMARQGMWLPLERKTTEPTWILQQSRVVWYHLEAALPFRQLHCPRTTYFNIKLPVPFGSTRKCCNLWGQSKLEPECNNQGNCWNYVKDKIFLVKVSNFLSSFAKWKSVKLHFF